MLYQNKTFVAKKEDLGKTWLVLDAKGQTLGRFASEVAKILRGKHKPTYTPHLLCGDGVIIINAEKIEVTGHKEAQKVYYDYSGYPSGGKFTPYRRMKERHPDRILERAVRGMIPRNRLGRAIMKRLRIFKGAQHDMQAQKPIIVTM